MLTQVEFLKDVLHSKHPTLVNNHQLIFLTIAYSHRHYYSTSMLMSRYGFSQSYSYCPTSLNVLVCHLWSCSGLENKPQKRNMANSDLLYVLWCKNIDSANVGTCLVHIEFMRHPNLHWWICWPIAAPHPN